jgi:hypothetical protein
VLCDELSCEPRDRVGVGEDREGVVLGPVAGTAGMALHDERPLPARAPVRRALEAHAPIEDPALGVRDLVRRRLPDHDVRVERHRVLGDVRVQDRLLVFAARLARVERDDGGDRGVLGAPHALDVELVIVVPEHIEVERRRGTGEQVLEDPVHVVSTDVEEVKVPRSSSVKR